MLKTWHDQGRSSTYGKLAAALREVEKARLAERFEVSNKKKERKKETKKERKEGRKEERKKERKANMTKPRKRLNPELSDEISRCEHSNESSR